MFDIRETEANWLLMVSDHRQTISFPTIRNNLFTLHGQHWTSKRTFFLKFLKIFLQKLAKRFLGNKLVVRS